MGGVKMCVCVGIVGEKIPEQHNFTVRQCIDYNI